MLLLKFSRTFRFVYEKNHYLLFSLLLLLFVIDPIFVDNRLMYQAQSSKFFFFIDIVKIIGIVTLLRFTSLKQITISAIDVLASLIFISQLVNVLWFYGLNAPFEFSQTLGLYTLYISLRICGKELISYLFISVVFLGIVQSIYGSMQLHGLLPSNNAIFKITGSFFNPAPFAGFLAIALPIAIGVFINKNVLTLKTHFQKVISFLSITCFLLILVILPSTASRASWLAAAVSSVYILISSKKFEQWKSKFTSGFIRNVIIFLAIITCIVSTYLYYFKKDSADGRLTIWKISTKMFIQRPLFGYGFGKFKSDYMDFQHAYFENGSGSPREMVLSDNVQYPYNEILRILVEHGLLGLLLFAAVYWYVFYRTHTNKANVHHIQLVRGGLLALLLFSLFSYPSEILPILMLSIFCVAIVASHGEPIKVIRFNNELMFKRSFVLITAIGLFILFNIWWVNNVNKKSFVAWKNATELYQSGEYKLSLANYHKAYPSIKTNGIFLSNYGKALSVNGQHKMSNDILEKSSFYFKDNITYLTLGDNFVALKDYDKAEMCYKKAYSMVPSRLYAKYCLAKLYFLTNQKGKALLTAKEILIFRSKIKSTAESQIKTEIRTLLQKYQLPI